jgi:cytidylate kinase
MTAAVVTFSNQTGANGAAIARAVADRLRYRYFDWEVIAQAAAAAGISAEAMALAAAERPPNLFERIMGHLLAAGDPEELEPLASRPLPFRQGSEGYRQFIEQVVRELGRVGDAVIVGHAGQVLLKETPGAVKVLLRGSRQKRIGRVAREQGSTPEEARRLIEEIDQQRREFFKRVYRTDWLDASNYDVALNTDRLSVELARDMIVAMAHEVL